MDAIQGEFDAIRDQFRLFDSDMDKMEQDIRDDLGSPVEECANELVATSCAHIGEHEAASRRLEYVES